MENLKIIIADDSAMFRNGLKNVLKTVSYIKDIKEASNGEQVIKMAKKNKGTNLIFMDIRMPVKNGIEATKHVKKHFSSVKVIALTGSDIHFISFFKMLNAGADAYLTKHTKNEELLYAIDEVMNGRNYFSKDIPEILKEEVATRHDDMVIQGILDSLTDREKEVLVLICKGYSVKEISDKLFISPKTVEVHKKHIFEKTKCKKHHGLVFFAVRANLICQNIFTIIYACANIWQFGIFEC